MYLETSEGIQISCLAKDSSHILICDYFKSVLQTER